MQLSCNYTQVFVSVLSGWGWMAFLHQMRTWIWKRGHCSHSQKEFSNTVYKQMGRGCWPLEAVARGNFLDFLRHSLIYLWSLFSWVRGWNFCNIDKREQEKSMCVGRTNRSTEHTTEKKLFLSAYISLSAKLNFLILRPLLTSNLFHYISDLKCETPSLGQTSACCGALGPGRM